MASEDVVCRVDSTCAAAGLQPRGVAEKIGGSAQQASEKLLIHAVDAIFHLVLGELEVLAGDLIHSFANGRCRLHYCLGVAYRLFSGLLRFKDRLHRSAQHQPFRRHRSRNRLDDPRITLGPIIAVTGAGPDRRRAPVAADRRRT